MCFLLLAAEKKDTENGAAVTSLGPFLFRDDFINGLAGLAKTLNTVKRFLSEIVEKYFLSIG